MKELMLNVVFVDVLRRTNSRRRKPRRRELQLTAKERCEEYVDLGPHFGFHFKTQKLQPICIT